MNRIYSVNSVNHEILSLFYDWDLLAELVNGNVNHLSFSDPHAFALPEALHLHDHAHRNRRRADANCLRIETHQVTDEYRLVKDHFLHRHRHEAFHMRMAMRFDGSGRVDVAQDNATENRAA